jgi:hypothetical protein
MSHRSAGSVIGRWDELSPEDLKFDLHNPRFAGTSFGSQEQMLQYLYDHVDVDELIQSIMSAGYIDFEPLVVLADENIVLEGNRRLAALRLIADEDLRASLDVRLPDIDDPPPLPELLRVLLVDNRDEARAFIGFKHINGPFKWDALAKAQYAADWFTDGGDIETVSRTLGDNHRTVQRLVNGWFALQQAIDEGFDMERITRKTFAFSHLYTALARPSVRDFLGMGDEDLSTPPRKNPISREYIDNLLKLMSWLYGQEQKGESTLIQSQNPNLNQLTRILGNPEAIKVLYATGNLQTAFERVEPPSIRFDEALVRTSQYSEEAMKLSAYYLGDPTLFRVAENTDKTVRTLLMVMRQIKNDREHEAE